SAPVSKTAPKAGHYNILPALFGLILTLAGRGVDDLSFHQICPCQNGKKLETDMGKKRRPAALSALLFVVAAYSSCARSAATAAKPINCMADQAAGTPQTALLPASLGNLTWKTHKPEDPGLSLELPGDLRTTEIPLQGAKAYVYKDQQIIVMLMHYPSGSIS